MIKRVSYFGLFLISIAAIAGCQPEQPSAMDQVDASSVAGTVQLVVNIEGREPIEVDVPCSADSTVLSILQRAQNIGDLKFEHRGSGSSAFITSIEGVANEGAGADNWIYRVNDNLGDRSCGVYSVKPKDRIVWSLGDYEPENSGEGGN